VLRGAGPLFKILPPKQTDRLRGHALTCFAEFHELYGSHRTIACAAAYEAGRGHVFSGIIETTSPVLSISNARQQRILTIRKPRDWKLQDGESISVEGVCSTIQSFKNGSFRVVYMPETLRKTTLGGLKAGDEVNLERCLTLQSLIGGHMVQGHVDTTARIKAVQNEGAARLFTFAIPPRFSRYIVPKGSITVDGISLTVVEVTRSSFRCSLLAYTLSRTTLGGKRPGRQVNIEVDILGKYIERLLNK